MLFHVMWEFVDTTEEGERRSLSVFSQWQPPEGAQFQGFYGFADGGGVVHQHSRGDLSTFLSEHRALDNGLHLIRRAVALAAPPLQVSERKKRDRHLLAITKNSAYF